jgi:hypothetical protein
MKWTPSGSTNSSSPSLALRAGRHPNRSANYTAVNLGLPLTVTDAWTQPTSKKPVATRRFISTRFDWRYDPGV